MKILKTNLCINYSTLESLKLLSLVGVLIVIVSTFGVNNAFAEGIIYEPNELVVRNNPTVCSIQPLDPDLTEKQIEKFSTQSRASATEWQQHLQSGVGKTNWPNWEINFKQFDYDKFDSDAVLGCDIVMIFSKTPPNLSFWNILGLAMSDYETGKTIIEIYYLTPQLCDSGIREKDPRENIIWIFQEPCYGDMMISSQLGSVIRHELGHALGLGHYMSADEDETLSWNKGLAAAPSIMVEISYENTNEQRIAPRDIEKLQIIYGDDGFFLNSEELESLTLVNPYLTEQNYVDFQNSNYGFTIQYPEKWGVDDTVEKLEDFTSVLHITDEEESLNRSFKVGFFSKSVFTGSNDKEIFDKLVENEQKYCDEYLAEEFGFVCENLILLDAKTQNGENGKFYTIKSIWNDGTHHQIIHRNYIFSGDKIWEISGTGALAPFLLAKNVMEHSMTSFRLDDSVDSIPPITSKPESQIDLPPMELNAGPAESTQIPDWVRGNAEWWAQGAIGDFDFVSGIQYLIKEGIMTIPETAKAESGGDSKEIPLWIKNNADWWAQGLITDDDFVKGIQYLVEQGIISV